ncbi:Gfo/Idh/MocA family protein [Puniceicoccus vermicola]|uniref:Gfo/Idh/MocA family oxidoreductase n=1 Tax=Puniceicoccus vermicola TaxID=388746 RepID=A0A7X1E621_9BACT|nr:Gfo/Idh/MocA family oxidoreductase [Puniceicoccus vermicola]MBC2602197.1 Gfo/Idh/MocA family oxidoreductase [Puniceicoccus vermicola]
MKKELRIGVIGVSGRGKLARLAHKPGEGSRIVAGADPHPPFLKEFEEATNAEFLTHDYRELAAREDIDAVFVSSPDYLHEEHTVACLEAGKSVYLEKPMAITVAGCDRILEAARKSNAKLYLGHNMRHMPFVLQMKKIIDDGLIGEVKAGWCRHFVGWGGDYYFKDWHADRRNTTGLLLQKGSHDIDILHWLCGGYSKRVSAMGGLTLYDQIEDRDSSPEPGKRDWSEENWPPLSQKGLHPIIDVEDISMVQMELNNGVFCSYQQCHYTPDYWRNYTIIGTEGRIENFGDVGEGTVIKLWKKRSEYNAEADEQFGIAEASGSHGGADPQIVQEFLDFARDGSKATTSPVAARYSVAAACEATDSIRNGSAPRDVKPLPPELVAYFE